MKEFIQKYRKVIIIVAIILLLLTIGISIYFIFFNKNSKNIDTNSNQTESSESVTPPPTYVLSDSSEAITATYLVAQQWSSDSKLYNCSGLTLSSVKYSDVTYYFLGAQEGQYSSWICTYYSDSKEEIKIFKYSQGETDDSTESMPIGEYGYLTYGSVDYPTMLEDILSSTQIYQKALDLGVDMENNYVNMYLVDTSEYGFVWKVDERSKTEVDEYGIEVVDNTYIFDIYTGESKGVIAGSLN